MKSKSLRTIWTLSLGLLLGLAIVSFAPRATGAPPPPPPSVLLTRGPYIQLTTQTNAIIRWRTDMPSGSWVRFGRTAENLNRMANDPEPTTEHRIYLQELSPGTRYYYSISDDEGMLAGGEDYYFTTAPASPKPTRIWVIGDSGTASAGDFGSWLVRDAYYAYAQNREPDVWLMLGDNAYGVGTDYEFQVAVFETYPELLRRTAVWSALGNHETYAPLPTGDLSYFQNFDFPTQGEAGGIPSGTERYYSFNYGSIHFVAIDSELSERGPGSPMLNWLEADLEANTNEWIIAFWHSPPYSKGSHDSDNLFDNRGNMTDMRQYVNPILENHGVDLVLCGHSHNYERSYLMRGHYGFSWELAPMMILDQGSGQSSDTGPYLKPDAGANANHGTVYIVAGSSGWATGRWGFHPIMHVSYQNRGSLVIDIDGDRLDVKYLRETGTIDDHFTIIKGGDPEPLRFANVQVADGLISVKWKSVAGGTYRIEKRTDLAGAEWVAFSEEIVATGATSAWEGFILPNDEKCFFRVVRLD